jgi:hypothetical protein
VLPGIEIFQGPVVHAAEWDQDYDLRGGNIVVIGNGCKSSSHINPTRPSNIFEGSAAQVVLAIVDDVKGITQLIRVTKPSVFYLFI